MSYIELKIQAPEAVQEVLISSLSDLNATGFEQTEESLVAYFDADGFPEKEVQTVLANFTCQQQRIEEQNWNQVWESNFQPVQVGEFCGIRAAFHVPMPHVTHEIVITPKMSFGTGHHATTFMMVEQMSRINFVAKEVFDFGTGTGILAILAEKLGAAHVDAIDVDHWSIENAYENLQRNHCSGVSLTLTSIIPQKTYDIILANINKNVILNYLGDLNKALVTNGSLLVSGLLIQDREDIINACEGQGLRLDVSIERSNWVSLLFSKH